MSLPKKGIIVTEGLMKSGLTESLPILVSLWFQQLFSNGQPLAPHYKHLDEEAERIKFCA